MRRMTSALLVMIALGTAAGQTERHPQSDSPKSYSNASLGFRYTPPSGLRDQTKFLMSQIQKEEGSAGTANVHRVLLALFSTEEGEDPSWRSLTIETYPRSAISAPDDASAEAKMSAWLAHSEDANPSSNKLAVVSGQKFSV